MYSSEVKEAWSADGLIARWEGEAMGLLLCMNSVSNSLRVVMGWEESRGSGGGGGKASPTCGWREAKVVARRPLEVELEDTIGLRMVLAAAETLPLWVIWYWAFIAAASRGSSSGLGWESRD